MERIAAHVTGLTGLFLKGLLALPGVRVYGPPDLVSRGGTVAFNVEGVPFGAVEARAREAGVSLRGGCFCNPGASEAAFGLDPKRCLDQLGEQFTVAGLAACAGRPVGAVRASFGLATNEDDVRRAIEVVRGHDRGSGRGRRASQRTRLRARSRRVETALKASTPGTRRGSRP